jgi:hypothetical protein
MDPAHPCTGRAPLPQSSKRRSCISIQSSFFLFRNACANLQKYCDSRKTAFCFSPIVCHSGIQKCSFVFILTSFFSKTKPNETKLLDLFVFYPFLLFSQVKGGVKPPPRQKAARCSVRKEPVIPQNPAKHLRKPSFPIRPAFNRVSSCQGRQGRQR